MRIVVLGAAGGTGRAVTTEARRRGHRVVAVVRRRAQLGPEETALTVVPGDARDSETLRRALRGGDAVISTLPGGSRTDPHLAETAGRVLVSVMEELGIRRLVVTGAYPMVGERPRLAMWLLRRIFRTAYADVARLEEVLAASTLDWTVVRLNRLIDGSGTGRIEARPDLLDHPASISRADAAVLLVDVAESSEHSRIALNATTFPRDSG